MIHDAGSAYPCDGRKKAAAAVGELAESAENETSSSVRHGPVPSCAELYELGFNRPQFATLRVVYLLVEIAGSSKVLLRHIHRALFYRDRLSVFGALRAEGRDIYFLVGHRGGGDCYGLINSVLSALSILCS
jgi:hypothetical protein